MWLQAGSGRMRSAGGGSVAGENVSTRMRSVIPNAPECVVPDSRLYHINAMHLSARFGGSLAAELAGAEDKLEPGAQAET